ncbi:MAG: WecB/TagA/CpsF family glycosyltransferase [Candidatus Hydrogenedentes bacterium]|nr:WecB/TagA/CpsF family glycosyltransferase [Candidatus Hydrogenedentota bacterium]
MAKTIPLGLPNEECRRTEPYVEAVSALPPEPDERRMLFGIPMSCVTFQDVCRLIARQIRDRQPGFVVTPNVDHICRFQRDPSFREAYRNAWLVLPDGVPLIWVARWLGVPLRQKLSGSDLVPWLSEFAAAKGYSVFFFGAAEGVAEDCADRLRRRWPGLRVAGVYSPPLGFELDPAELARALHRIRASAPDICFVALGSPKQELWLHQYTQELGVPVIIGVGAGLDFAAGRLRRAPIWVQRMGLEWFWRLALEPRRLWRRYLVDDSLFFVLLFREWSQRLTKKPAGR